MHTFKSLGLCLALVQGILASPSRHAKLHSRQTVSSCTEPMHLIVGGGNNRSPGTQDVNGLLQSLVDDVTNAFPGTTEYLPPYDGTATPGPAAYKAFVTGIQNYTASCPEVPVVLIGYSFGGILMMNALCGGISPDYNANIIAAISYGEETQVANQSYDAGNCTTSSPGTYAQPRADPSTCDPYAAKIQSYCLSTDPNCCGTGTDHANHFAYPGVYDSAAFAFIKKQYYARLASTQPKQPTPTHTPTPPSQPKQPSNGWGFSWPPSWNPNKGQSGQPPKQPSNNPWGNGNDWAKNWGNAWKNNFGNFWGH